MKHNIIKPQNAKADKIWEVRLEMDPTIGEYWCELLIKAPDFNLAFVRACGIKNTEYFKTPKGFKYLKKLNKNFLVDIKTFDEWNKLQFENWNITSIKAHKV